MKITLSANEKPTTRSAFTLVEVMMGIMIMAVVFVSLYLGFTQGFGILQVARENLRATQILQEKMETIRLYTWDQMNTPGFIPTNFNAYFYPVGTQTNGVVYNGQMIISPAVMTENYAADHKVVTVMLNWTSGTVQRQRQMTTLVSRYGLHNYYY